MSITNFNLTLHLLLEPNLHLVHSNLDKGNNPYLVYHGNVYDRKSTLSDDLLDHRLGQEQDLGWASIMVHSDGVEPSFGGTVHFEGTTYSILPINDYNMVYGADIPAPVARQRHDKKALSVIFRSQDLGHSLPKTEGCKTPDVPIKVSSHKAALKRLMRRSNSGCSHDNKILYMAVAADCTYVQKHGTVAKAKETIIRNWNIVSGIYKKNFGVQLGIVDIFAPYETCLKDPYENMAWNRACHSGFGLEDRLNNFSMWAERSSHPKDTVWHLVTNCSSGNNVGLAYKGTLCGKAHQQIFYNSTTIEANMAVGVSSITAEPWKVIAHEIGHNFGADHDCDEKLCHEKNTTSGCCECSSCDCKGKFLMSPSATKQAEDFSICSREQICRGIDIIGTCIKKPDSRPVYRIKMCGNGIKEEGEDCDCGGVDGCKGNKCCDPKECKFINNAKCDDTNDKCCSACNPRPAGTVCRPARGSCDIVERCDGVQGACPDDEFYPNGLPCGNSRDELYCAQGQCTSRDLQCHEYTGLSNTTISSRACNINTGKCKFICASQGSSCTIYPGNFVDGTRCGRNLYCRDGTCDGKWIDYFLDMAENNLVASIMILIGLCFFLATFLYSCIFRRFRHHTPPPPTTPLYITLLTPTTPNLALHPINPDHCLAPPSYKASPKICF
ncbi:hypothetical protein DSO57_1013041 [Entomophthora muscae]|uniref:Uncharacterized protein n=1 Tax=Entomophthora muscae TaxID=34485 RepID=A0ACC2RWY4_9FUNG|nr:hypothetical protein DSO57_1013041 [Entomophthora muscae]